MNEPKYAVIKFNGGRGALLCNGCSIIIAYGLDHADTRHFCDKCKVKEALMTVRVAFLALVGEIVVEIPAARPPVIIKQEGHVSTIFLGIEIYREGQTSPRECFETMIFGGRHDGYQRRCGTWDEMCEQHCAAVALDKT